jgi:hypothetical protein
MEFPADPIHVSDARPTGPGSEQADAPGEAPSGAWIARCRASATLVQQEDKTMSGIRNRLQHIFNPLHVYCRLRAVGLNVDWAVRMSAFYERWVYPGVGR